MPDDDGTRVSEAVVLPHPAACPRVVDDKSGPSPREKLRRQGSRVLSTTELLELISGLNRLTAGRVLKSHGLERLSGFTYQRWLSRSGVGPIAAGRLCAVFELHRRLSRSENALRPRVSNPEEAFKIAREIAAHKKEHLVGLYLDAQNLLIARETITMGSLNTTRTHPREILYPAIQNLALGFILVHNHPSGSLTPSVDDVEFTRAVRRAGELMGIDLYDHIIVSERGFVSMREKGLL